MHAALSWEKHNNCPTCRQQCDPEPTTIAKALLPELAQLQGQDGSEGFDFESLLGNGPLPRSWQTENSNREDYSMYS